MPTASVVSAASKRATVAELIDKLVDVLFDEKRAEECKPDLPVDRALSPKYSNKLTPPVGASYWRLQSFVPMKSVEFIFKFFGTTLHLETLTWSIDAYVYVVNATPDSDFQKNGGAVYVALVHGGSAVTGPAVASGVEYRYGVSLRNSSGSAMKQLPHTNSGAQDGDYWKYPISFTQDMQMFKNGGNEAFTFQAGYEDSIDIHKGQQTGYLDSTSSVRWGVVLDEPSANTNFPFGALSLFKFNSLDLVTFDCNASVYGKASDVNPLVSNTQSITVDCRFSP